MCIRDRFILPQARIFPVAAVDATWWLCSANVLFVSALASALWRVVRRAVCRSSSCNRFDRWSRTRPSCSKRNAASRAMFERQACRYNNLRHQQ
eukprot:6548887-Prymnesium_polylepis.1